MRERACPEPTTASACSATRRQQNGRSRWLLLAAERERVEARAARITHLFTSNRLLEIRYQF
jgi:hypothetical protein